MRYIIGVGSSNHLCAADREYVEVSLGGTWITVYPEHENGILIPTLSDRIELLLFKLWQATKVNASVSQKASDW
ncbi:MAG: hypothetical protein QNJ68_01300 [Microcoleaceae cyanobacterium MO_207.B10]|nr:hypothetical protein [Microcoleaceae cyanobacterium MO_207.B10]